MNLLFQRNVLLKLTICSVTLSLLAGAAMLAPGAGRFSDTYQSEDEAIRYKETAPENAITRLQKEIDAGRVHLTSIGRQGLLAAVLKQLKIPLNSQLLVFSKTSFQREIITPNNPRALYYNDSTYIGWVQGSPLIEVATIDPKLGTVFYVMDQYRKGKPYFKRETDECLECHETGMSGGIPGNIFRSVYPHADGQPEFSAGSYLTDDSSPMEERWGGWYVTGKHGAIRHMGNALVHGSQENAALDRNSGANVTNLSKFLSTAHYLQPTSDIASLMVAEHQTHIQNLITVADYQTRIAARYDEALNRDLNRPKDYHSDSERSRIAGVCEPLLRAMLFTEEPQLANPITGSNSFAVDFSKLGPTDGHGRSLRQLDLKRRLMRFRCSYLIYSEQFKALPDRAKSYLYARLHQILTGKDSTKDFASITAAVEERQAILEILNETDPEFYEGGKKTLQAVSSR